MSLTSNTKEVLLMESYYEIRQGYSLLKSEEKENLWLMKYNTILNNDKETLTEFQKEIIKDLKNFLTKYGMSTLILHPEIGQKYLSSNLENFKKNFSQEQILLLIEHPYFNNGFTINKSTEYINKLIVAKPKNSVLIESSTFGPPCSCYYSVSCVGFGYVCTEGKDNCYHVAECGLFGTSNCTGRCRDEPETIF